MARLLLLRIDFIDIPPDRAEALAEIYSSAAPSMI
jgi:hypothetical protein